MNVPIVPPSLFTKYEQNGYIFLTVWNVFIFLGNSRSSIFLNIIIVITTCLRHENPRMILLRGMENNQLTGFPLVGFGNEGNSEID